MHSISELIALKQNAECFTEEQIQFFIDELLKGSLHDAQIGAFLMAVFLKGMTRDEVASLTKAMKSSGDVLQWPLEWKDNVVDKHSTGGVGDKISLVLAPAVAACGLKVPMISGRSLGFTGGTLDKLESIPGFNINFSSEDITKALTNVGCCIVGQTKTIVPADKILYSIRDITSTVASLPLITSSIISKKAAENLSSLVLDVKHGSGSFNNTIAVAEELASVMVEVSEKVGIKTCAVITNMDHPIGNMVGNSLEIIETVECLQGRGPEDLMELVVTQGGTLLYLNGKASSLENGKAEIVQKIQNGEALEKFRQMVIFQGVDNDLASQLCKEPRSVLQLSSNVTSVCAKDDGYISNIKARVVGEVSAFGLGCGRRVPTDNVTHDTGIQIENHIGEKVEKGDTIFTVYHKEEKLANELKERLENCVTIVPGEVKRKSRIDKIVGRDTPIGRVMASQ